MTVYVGIDPGLDGGLAVVLHGPKPHASTVPMPTIGAGAAKRVLDGHAIREWLDYLNTVHEVALCAAEEALPIPRQSAVSAHKAGVGYGRLLGLLDGLRVPYETVSPGAWKKAMGLPGRGSGVDAKSQKARKRDAIELAQRLFPGVSLLATERSRVPHDGLAEAVLLAEYARRRHQGAA